MYYNGHRNRILYFVVILFLFVLSFISKVFSNHLPTLISTYTSLVIYGMVVYFLFGILFYKKRVRILLFASILFTYTLEWSQLMHISLLNYFHGTTLGFMIFHGFSYLNLICYTAGIFMSLFIEFIWIHSSQH